MIVRKNYKDINEEEMMNLIYPSASHMDFNIASALKYSAEGKGFELSTDFFEEKGFKEFLDLMDKFVSEK